MANYMAEVAKLLGVELGKEFEIEDVFDLKYKLTNQGSLLYGIPQPEVLCKLLRGEFIIKCPPWKPKYNEEYWCVGINSAVGRNYWDGHFVHVINYKLGNCYRTKAEAEANRDKWVAFYASDEVLDV